MLTQYKTSTRTGLISKKTDQPPFCILSILKKTETERLRAISLFNKTDTARVCSRFS